MRNATNSVSKFSQSSNGFVDAATAEVTSTAALENTTGEDAAGVATSAASIFEHNALKAVSWVACSLSDASQSFSASVLSSSCFGR